MVEEVSRLLRQARGAYQREQYQVALAYFQQACQVDSHSPEALLGLGEVSSFLGFRDQAINAFLSLADLYLRAAMFEVAAEVIERILDLDPENPVALRFQRFIQPRLRPSPSEQTTAVTLVERPTPAPKLRHALGSEKTRTEDVLRNERADSAVTTDVKPPIVTSDLDEFLLDMRPGTETPTPIRRETEVGVAVKPADKPRNMTDVALAETQLARIPQPSAEPTQSRIQVTIAPVDDEDEDEDSEVRTRTFDGASDLISSRPAESESSSVIFDFDDEDDDLVSYTQLDPDAESPSGIFKVPSKPEPSRLIQTGETSLEVPVRPASPDPGMFDEVATRSVPDEMLEVLAESEEDPFSSDTVNAGELPRLLARRTDPRFLDPVESPWSADGTGDHEPEHLWEVNTEAAVAAENFRKRPAIRIDAGEDELDLSNFPAFEEQDADAPATQTIALQHKDALIMLEDLAPVSPLITQLGPAGRLRLVESCALLQCFAGQVVCREGDTGRDLYLLLSGQAAVERVPNGSASPQRIASLSPGAFFGEGSVLAEAPRSSTVRIIDDALLIEIERSILQELVRERPHLLTVLTRFLRARLVSSLMMSSPLFGELDVEERAALAPLLHLHKLNPGQQVVRRGQLVTGFCTVMAGELECSDLAEGTGKHVVAPIRTGESFGIDCLHGRPSRLSINAVTGCWLMRLPTDNLRELVNQHPTILDALTTADRLA